MKPLSFSRTARRWRLPSLGGVIVGAWLLADGWPGASALGDDHWRQLHEEVRAGRLVGLPVILDWLERHYEGQVLEVELERDDGMLVYEIEMIGPQGQIVEFEFDAASGELIGIEGVNVNAMRRR